MLRATFFDGLDLDGHSQLPVPLAVGPAGKLLAAARRTSARRVGAYAASRPALQGSRRLAAALALASQPAAELDATLEEWDELALRHRAEQAERVLLRTDPKLARCRVRWQKYELRKRSIRSG